MDSWEGCSYLNTWCTCTSLKKTTRLPAMTKKTEVTEMNEMTKMTQVTRMTRDTGMRGVHVSGD